MKRFVVLMAVVLVSGAAFFLGCTRDNPVDMRTATPVNSREQLLPLSQLSQVLVPNGDVPTYGWRPHPVTPWSRYDKIDEGVPNLDNLLIYTDNPDIMDRFTFTDVSGYDNIDVSQIKLTIPLDSYIEFQSSCLHVQLDLWYYINGDEMGHAVYECGPLNFGVDCGDTTWVVTFDGVCYNRTEINSLEVKILSSGLYWDEGDAELLINAIDAEVAFDTVCTPVIEDDLASSRNGNTVTVTWTTGCESTSKVIWGYSPGSLTNTATGSNGTNHGVNFAVGGTEGCVYFKAISAGLTCSAPADTSGTMTNIKDVVISNVVRTFDATQCKITVTWTTNVKSSSTVYWGTSCGSLTHTATGTGNVTSHSVSFDATYIPRGSVYIKAESASGCDTEQSSCNSVRRDYCISQ